MRKNGSVTVFLSIAFVCIAALLLGIAESARTSGARFYMQVAADAAMESLFSQYHRKLWTDYRVLGLEYKDETQLLEEFHAFMLPYQESRDWYPSNMDADQLFFTEKSGLSEAAYFEEEALAYMQYGMADSLIRFLGEGRETSSLGNDLTNLFARAEESETLRELQSRYQLGAKDVSAVEQAIAEISDAAAKAADRHDEAGSALRGENDSAFYRKAAAFQEALRDIKKAVPEYTAAADALREKVLQLRIQFAKEKDTLSPEGVQIIETQLAEYESYVSEKGSVRQEIEAMPAQADTLISQTDSMITEVREFEAWISERLDERDEDDDYDYSAEIRAFYRSMSDSWNGMTLIRYSGSVSRIDRQTKAALERVTQLFSTEMLRLVLPEDVRMPSRNRIHPSLPQFYADSEANPLEKIMLGEYAFRHFHYYQEMNAQAKLPASESTDYELEYLIAGNDSNYENLSSIVMRLVALREAMNLIYLFADHQKRAEARTFVTQLLCVTANPVLIAVLTFFVLGVWALGQAIYDVKTLLADTRVPLLHTAESWSLDLDGLLSLGKSGQTGGIGQTDTGKGMSYQDYLRVFLYGAGLSNQKEINRRMLTRIQNNIRTVGDDAQNGFSLEHCLYAAGIQGRRDEKHVMYGVGLLRSMADRTLNSIYSVQFETYYKYRSETH